MARTFAEATREYDAMRAALRDGRLRTGKLMVLGPPMVVTPIVGCARCHGPIDIDAFCSLCGAVTTGPEQWVDGAQRD